MTNLAKNKRKINIRTAGEAEVFHRPWDISGATEPLGAVSIQRVQCWDSRYRLTLPGPGRTIWEDRSQEVRESVFSKHLVTLTFYSGIYLEFWNLPHLSVGFCGGFKISQLVMKELKATSQLPQRSDICVCVQYLLVEHICEMWCLCYLLSRKNSLSQHSNYVPLKCKFRFMH